MAKKKHSGKHPSPLSLPRRLLEGVRESDELMKRKHWPEARDLLEDLDEHYPGQPYVLTNLVNTYYELKDMAGYQRACERLLKADDSDPDLRLGLAGAYLSNGFPMLALRAFREFLRREPDHPRAAETRDTVALLEEGMANILAEIGIAGAEGQQLAEWHEEVQSCLSQGQYARGRRLAEDLLRQHPTFAPALNNLTQIHAVEGRLPEAIATAKRVLAFAPDNVHALSNLTRCLYLSGQFAEAQQSAAQLMVSQAPATEGWLKKMEALSYLGNDEDVLAVFHQAEQAAAAEDDQHNPMVWHLAAVAALRLGQEPEAKGYWQQALKLRPGFDLAQENLADLRQPREKRNAPWAFPLNNWLNASTVKELSRLIANLKGRSEEALTGVVQRFLRQHPHLTLLAPTLLERGGRAGREFMLMLARLGGAPELLTPVKAFALGQHGPDDLRMQAAQIAVEQGALPSGMVRLWMQGEWRDLLLMGFELHGEPVRPYKHKPQVERWLYDALQATHDGDDEEAEHLLKQALAVEPDKPDLLNNLAAVYAATGREPAALELWQQIFDRSPDYLFARASLARAAALRGEADKARELLAPLFSRRRLHFSEFAAFSGAQIDLLLAEGHKDGARSWFEMWAEATPDDPRLDHYRRLVGKPARKMDWRDRFRGQRT
jgi:tetratricopeptide (TPR) repeat protein